nr:hypothetical protein BaRGS_010396 [Batillaria attramentaria]
MLVVRLRGEKQRIDRGYDFTGVLEWFAERVDRIILLFDAHKLDISDEFRRAIEAIKEEQDLFKDLQSLPRNAALRKLNDLIKRARLAKVHAYIISYLKKEMPSMFGKDNKKKELISKLGDIFGTIQREHQISPGDFPNLKRMQEQLAFHDFTKFHQLKPKLLEAVDNMLANDIARLMQMIPHEEETMVENNAGGGVVQGGAFEGYIESPFGIGRGEGIDMGRGEHEWVVGKEKYEYDDSFQKLNPINGKITGAAAKSEMVKSKLPNSVLSKVWKLADVDRDGMLDADEWALANHLIKIKLDGHDLPSDLPDHLIPPSKRNDMA